MPTYRIQITQEIVEIHEYTIEADTEEQARQTAYSAYDGEDYSETGTLLSSNQWNSEENNEITSVHEVTSD